ncbi:hypothetical protein [Paenibacillus polymyxa]|uniref:hypothetical protein n=1 Tax=Paenibacillus polymyxa TaxID=1406 RepID=UPI00307F5511
MWNPYEHSRQHPHDFIVEYRFYTPEEGGRKQLPIQGYRCDFSYEGDDITTTGIYAIHPEFEDEEGQLIMDTRHPVYREGQARMWILFGEMREKVHRHRIHVGTRGYFMEGPRRVGEVEVTSLVGLLTNPLD